MIYIEGKPMVAHACRRRKPSGLIGSFRAESVLERSFSTNPLASLVVPDDLVFRSLREHILSAHQDIFGPVATVQHPSRDTIPSASAREHHGQQHQPCVFPHRLSP